MGTITTLDKFKSIADPDLSSISTKYVGYGSQILRAVAPIFISNKDMITDKKFVTDSLDGQNVIRPRLAKSGFSTITNEKVFINLEERVHESRMDHREYDEDPDEIESVAIQACAYPPIQSMIYELNALMQDDSNYVTAREVDVDATGTAANDWTAPTTCTPLTNIRSAFTKFIASARVLESDPNMKLVISPYLAGLVVNSDEYKTEVAARDISEPTLLKDRLEAVLNRSVILAEGWYYGENGSVLFTTDATCHVIYVDEPVGGLSNITRFRTNESTFLTGMRDLELPMPPVMQRIGEDEIFNVSAPIIATWKYAGRDGVTEINMASLLRGTVWIHDLSKLVRLKDIVA